MVTGTGTTQYAVACPERSRRDAADRLTSVTPSGASPFSYTFDDNGNLTAPWLRQLLLGRGGPPHLRHTVSGTTTTFAYNGDGLRDSLTTGGNTTTFTPCWECGHFRHGLDFRLCFRSRFHALGAPATP